MSAIRAENIFTLGSGHAFGRAGWWIVANLTCFAVIGLIASIVASVFDVMPSNKFVVFIGFVAGLAIWLYGMGVAGGLYEYWRELKPADSTRALKEERGQ